MPRIECIWRGFTTKYDISSRGTNQVRVSSATVGSPMEFRSTFAWHRFDLLIDCSFVTLLNYNCCSDYLLYWECAIIEIAITSNKNGVSAENNKNCPYIRLSYLSNPCFWVPCCGVAAVPWEDVNLFVVFIGGGLIVLLVTTFPAGGGGIENEE